MIEISGRGDVLVQWFSDAFIRNHNELFQKVIVQPGEAMFTIRDGKPGDIITETNSTLIPGFFGKLKEAVFGKKDIQMMYVDLKNRIIQIPISGYTKDRAEIKCVANLIVKISRANILRVMNLTSLNLVSDRKWGPEASDVKEICNEDLSEFFGYDTKVVVDSMVFTKFDSNYVRDNAVEFNKAISDAINTLMPHWAASGLEVNVTSVEVTENGYEEVMKYKSLMSQTQMVEDIRFTREKGNLGNVASLEAEKKRLDGEVKLEELRSKYAQSGFEFEKEWEQKLREADLQTEMNDKNRADAVAEAKNSAEILEIQGASQANIEKMKAEVEIFRKEKELELRFKETEFDTDNQIRLKKTEAEIDYTNKLEKIKLECAKAVQKAESDVKAAYSEGYAKGFDEGMNTADSRNKTQGEMVINMMGAVGNISRGQFQAAPPAQQQNSGCRFCPACGSPTNGANFCASCGNRL